MKGQELEDRLIDFAVSVVGVADTMSGSISCRHLAAQLMRSGTSAALNYGEARAGESRRDFIHKIKIVLKELRESFICLRIIIKSQLCKDRDISSILNENNELISIFVRTALTAERNLEK